MLGSLQSLPQFTPLAALHSLRLYSVTTSSPELGFLGSMQVSPLGASATSCSHTLNSD